MAVASVAWAGDKITFADLGLENGVQYLDPFDGGSFTVTFAGGQNDGKYYNTGSGIRVYGNGTMTIAAKSGNVTSITITYDGSNKPTSNDVVNVGEYNNSTGVWTGSEESVVFTRPSGSGHWRVKSIEVTVETASGDTPSISADNVDIAYNATQGAIAYTLANEVTGGSVSASTTSSWLTLGTDFASPIAFTCEANDGAERTATVTLTYTYGNDNVSKNVTVTQAGDPNRPGTENNPYTVAQAVQAIDDANQGTVSDVYVAGIVSQVDSYNNNNGEITYWISDDGTTTDQFEVYRGKGIGGANFTSQNDVKVGDEVVVKGNITYYANGGVYEFAANNQLVSLNRPVSTTPTVTVAQTAVNVDVAGGDGTINVTYENFSQNTDISVQIQDATGAPTTFGWFDADIDNNNNVYYLVDPNTDTAERTAYLRVMVADKDAKEVYYSDVITITQEAYVAPSYAVLPFSFNDGRSDIEGTEGLSHNGLGTDYNASTNPKTKLKFDGTGDWLLLQFDEKPGKLSFDIKGNSFSGGTFKVQASEDGVTFTDLASYTELGDAATKEFNLDANVRYVKWIYTEKVTGNVGLGNISLEKPTVTITIKQDFTATTFSCDKALDFTGQNIQAYIITDENGTTESVEVVAAGEGLYIEGEPGKYEVPIYDGLDPDPMLDNLLVGTIDEAVNTKTLNEGDYTYYLFGKQSGKEAFFKVGENTSDAKATASAGKA
ncbi:MAG: BACON domain-containing protein, partial [Prevotella sp.]|nr:BACON domain-containing protein [Prevotella sp.]